MLRPMAHTACRLAEAECERTRDGEVRHEVRIESDQAALHETSCTCDVSSRGSEAESTMAPRS